MKNPDPDIDDPFYEDGPSGETLLEALKQMSIEEIATVLNFALRKTTHARNPESGSSNTGTAHGLGLVRKSRSGYDVRCLLWRSRRDGMGTGRT